MTIIPSSSSILWVYLEKRVCKRLKKKGASAGSYKNAVIFLRKVAFQLRRCV